VVYSRPTKLYGPTPRSKVLELQSDSIPAGVRLVGVTLAPEWRLDIAMVVYKRRLAQSFYARTQVAGFEVVQRCCTFPSRGRRVCRVVRSLCSLKAVDYGLGNGRDVVALAALDVGLLMREGSGCKAVIRVVLP